jgi:hypothetical protein
VKSLSLLAVFVLICGIATAAETPTVSIADVDRAIAQATQYIVNSCGKDGKFVYEVSVADGKQSPDYNIVRHSGTMYALAMADAARPDLQVTATLQRATEFLLGDYVRRNPGATKGLAVWTAPPHQPHSGEVTLGAVALGVVGLAGVETVVPKAIPPGRLEALGRFVLFMQRGDGGFNMKYFARGKGELEVTGSLYYPGEAALALASLYELDHSERWLAACEAGLSYLAESRAGARTVPADHWALIATAKWFAQRKPSPDSAIRARLLTHAAQICESILGDQVPLDSPPELRGSLNKNGATCPTSTRLEGLQAALEFLPPEQKELRTRVEDAVHRGIGFLLNAQIKTGKYAGGVPHAIALPGDSIPPTIRIDYVQHFLSAMLRYRAMFAPAP